jgi:hypothetical protein
MAVARELQRSAERGDASCARLDLLIGELRAAEAQTASQGAGLGTRGTLGVSWRWKWRNGDRRTRVIRDRCHWLGELVGREMRQSER